MCGEQSMRQINKRRNGNRKAHEYVVVIERDEEGWYVGTVPSLQGCHTQAKTLDELTERIKEAILLCLEVKGNKPIETALEFIGMQKVSV
jgi:predicted RNase H-like HicB family nuclease